MGLPKPAHRNMHKRYLNRHNGGHVLQVIEVTAGQQPRAKSQFLFAFALQILTLIFLCNLLHVRSVVAQPIPTDKDMLAAYCFKSLRMAIAEREPSQLELERNIAKHQNSPATLEIIKENRLRINAQKANVARLGAYIHARTGGNIHNLMGAATQAERDLAARKVCGNRCLSTPLKDTQNGYQDTWTAILQCDATCEAESGHPLKRIQRCSNVDWLPF
jgi:hypothetical protein